MALFRMLASAALFVLSFRFVLSETIFPTNETTDLQNQESSPRYLLNITTTFGNMPPLELAPLGPYVNLPYSEFVVTNITAPLVINDFVTNTSLGGKIAYFSCEVPIDNSSPSELLSDMLGGLASYVILYSTSSDHCQGTNITQGWNTKGIFTVVDYSLSSQYWLEDWVSIKDESALLVTILPDLDAYTVRPSNSSVPNTSSQPSSGPKSHTGVIVGAITGGVAGLVICMILLCLFLRRRRRSVARLSPSTMGNKSELYAGSTDQVAAVAARTTHDVQDQSAVQKEILPHEMLSGDVSETIEERGRQRTRRSPSAEGVSGLGGVVHADTSPTTRSQTSSPVERRDEQATPDTSRNTNGLVSSTRLQPSLDSYAAAEADFAVQELWLISMRKRKLAEQAVATGKNPEQMGGRVQVQYEELMERESKLRRLLDDMQNGA